MRYKIKEIPSDGRVTVDQPLPAVLCEQAFQGMDVDLGATGGEVRGELSKDADDHVYLRGRLRATVVMPCAACLGAARIALDTPLCMTFVDEREATCEPGADDLLDDVDVACHDGEVVDLAPILREQLILGIPLSAHCREGCAGLCAVCGQDKNERSCGHQPEAAPSPLGAKLEKLRGQLPKGR